MNHKEKSKIGVVPAGFGLPHWTLLSVLMSILIVAALLTACAGEQPTPTPQTPAPLPPTPAAASPEDSAPEQRTAPPPNPTRRPTRAPMTITVTQPAPAQSQAPTLQLEIDTSLILWGDLFGQLVADEQNCLRAELGDGLLSWPRPARSQFHRKSPNGRRLFLSALTPTRPWQFRARCSSRSW